MILDGSALDQILQIGRHHIPTVGSADEPRVEVLSQVLHAVLPVAHVKVVLGITAAHCVVMLMEGI